MDKFTITEEESGIRLDVYVQEQMTQYSRSTIQKLLKNGTILINGKETRSAYKLKEGDVIDASNVGMGVVEDIDLKIVYEDDDCVVIDKPAGILSHSKGTLNTEATVASWLETRIKDIKGDRAGIVHRLDRGTSGIMICAKNNKAQLFLQKQFSDRKVKKVYLAIIFGRIDPEEAIIDMPIQRNPNSPSRFKVSVNGKSAITHYKVIKTKGRYSLLELTPQTGRTHQLRVHLAQMKHPIVGDNFYKGEEADRLYLHAESLEILLPSKKKMNFVSEPSKDFLKLVD
ncbi:MAG: RluA family pseudouridine synthase [Candidatus Saccharibacteria bacterium]